MSEYFNTANPKSQKKYPNYDAFISYTHKKLDREIAIRLHKLLETYRTPWSLVKLGVPRRLSRVFRDLDELPASSNLDDSICSALIKSRYLIVICSPRTNDSKWVLKEVETFKNTTGLSNVLPIIIEGEPEKSFPKILCFNEKGEKVEPLAADVRAPSLKEMLKKLDEEKLRILAPILGCTFDDLKRREYQRQARKRAILTTVLSSLVLIFSSLSYLLYIQRNNAIVSKQAALRAHRIAIATLRTSLINGRELTSKSDPKKIPGQFIITANSINNFISGLSDASVYLARESNWSSDALALPAHANIWGTHAMLAANRPMLAEDFIKRGIKSLEILTKNGYRLTGFEKKMNAEFTYYLGYIRFLQNKENEALSFFQTSSDICIDLMNDKNEENKCDLFLCIMQDYKGKIYQKSGNWREAEDSFRFGIKTANLLQSEDDSLNHLAISCRNLLRNSLVNLFTAAKKPRKGLKEAELYYQEIDKQFAGAPNNFQLAVKHLKTSDLLADNLELNQKWTLANKFRKNAVYGYAQLIEAGYHQKNIYLEYARACNKQIINIKHRGVKSSIRNVFNLCINTINQNISAEEKAYSLYLIRFFFLSIDLSISNLKLALHESDNIFSDLYFAEHHERSFLINSLSQIIIFLAKIFPGEVKLWIKGCTNLVNWYAISKKFELNNDKEIKDSVTKAFKSFAIMPKETNKIIEEVLKIQNLTIRRDLTYRLIKEQLLSKNLKIE